MDKNLSLEGWVEFNGGLICRFPNPRKSEPEFGYSERVAGFNLDYTIVRTVAKLVANKYEFEFVYHNCLLKLADLNRQDYSIVIISDQTLISRGIMSIEDLQYKFDFLVKLLAERRIPVIGIFTTKNNCYKKPHTWTWKFLSEIYRGAKKNINIKESFYCGSLAGRVAKKPYRKDLDYVDRAYAHNINLEFKTPEQVFRQSAENRDFYYENSLDDKEKDEFIEYEIEKYKSSVLFKFKNIYEYCLDQSSKLYPLPPGSNQKPSFMIMMIGPPCSGKTKLATLIASHTIVKKDNTVSSLAVIVPDHYYDKDRKLSAACRMRLLTNFIQDGRIIILDGNYPTHASREPYLKLAASYKMLFIFIKLSTPYKICRQFNHIKLEKSQDKFREPLNDSQFKSYNKNYQLPDLYSYMSKTPDLRCTLVEVPTIIITSVKEFRNIY
jgi:DNA 3'-phosphatase